MRTHDSKRRRLSCGHRNALHNPEKGRSTSVRWWLNRTPVRSGSRSLQSSSRMSRKSAGMQWPTSQIMCDSVSSFWPEISLRNLARCSTAKVPRTYWFEPCCTPHRICAKSLSARFPRTEESVSSQDHSRRILWRRRESARSRDRQNLW